MNGDAIKWAAGILVTIIMSATGYTVNQGVSNEHRITQLEQSDQQERSELDDIWGKYNKAIVEREAFKIKTVLLEQRVNQLEKEVEELKQRKK